MAKKQQKEKSIEETLWDSANKLRGSVEPSEYKHVVLSLIFLKYAYDRFVERRNELIADHKEAFADQPVFYNAKNVFYLNVISRWDYLMENAKQNDIAIKIDAALAQVEKDNPTLKGALPSNYYSGLGLDRTKLASLLDVIGKIDFTVNNIEHLSYMVLDDNDEIYLSKTSIPNGTSSGLSLGEHYILGNATEVNPTTKNFKLVIWLSNLEEAQEKEYAGTNSAYVTYTSI